MLKKNKERTHRISKVTPKEWCQKLLKLRIASFVKKSISCLKTTIPLNVGERS